MLNEVNHNINVANQVKQSESLYRWIKSHQVLCSLVKQNIGFFSHVQSRRIYWESLHMIDGAKPEIEGVNHNIDGAKCQVVEYFQSCQVKYSILKPFIDQINEDRQLILLNFQNPIIINILSQIHNRVKSEEVSIRRIHKSSICLVRK